LESKGEKKQSITSQRQKQDGMFSLFEEENSQQVYSGSSYKLMW